MRPVAGSGLLFSERTLEEQLAEGERVLVQTKRHPIVLWKPVGRLLAACVLWLWYAVEIPNPGKILDALTLAVLGLAAWLVWCEYERRHNRFIITDQRLLLYEGIITRKVPMMRLSKVTDVTYFRSVPGRLLGYGTIIIESAGQDQALNRLTYLPEPDTVYAELNGALFGRRAKEKAVTGKGRGMRGRRRGNGPGGDGPGPTGGPGTGGGPGPGGGPGGGPSAGPVTGPGTAGGVGGLGGPGSSGGTGGGGEWDAPGGPDRPGPVGGTDGTGGFLLPFDEETVFDIDQADVPPAGWRPGGRRPAYDQDSGTIYSSRRPSRRDEDTGPIPIQERPRRR